MAKTGDRFEMPDGSVYAVTAAAAESNGEVVGMEFTLPPGSVSPPPHVHDGITEDYEVIEGELAVLCGDSWSSLGPGESASIPPGTLHTFKVRGETPVRVRNAHRPAARFEDYIEHICRLTAARGIKRARDPRIPVYLSMIMLEYPETLRPGRTRESVAIKALARLGRLLGLSTEV